MGNRGSTDVPDEEFSDEDAQTLIELEKAQLPKSKGQFKQQRHSKTDQNSKSAYQSCSTWYGTAEKGTHFSESFDEGSFKQNANLRFYQNRIRTRPDPGFFIDEILSWYGHHEMMETHANVVLQWLFPTKNRSSRNEYSQPLQDHEVQAIRRNNQLLQRAKSAFTLMLEYYGMQPVISDNSEFNVQRSPNWEKRYQNFNSNPGNVMRITRMLSCMGEMGFDSYQCIWLRFLLTEVVVQKTIILYNEYTVNCWIDAIANEEEKIQMVDFYAQLRDMMEPKHSNFKVESDFDQDHEMETEPIDVDDEGSNNYHDIQNMNLDRVSDKQCIFMTGCSEPTHWLSNMPYVLFYLNRIKCQPEPGFHLEELKSEKSNIDLMFRIHKHIQWLFPTRNHSERNSEAIPLTKVEAEVFANSKELKEKFIQVYRLLLSCYGLDMVLDTGEILKTDTWTEMYAELDKLTPFPRIITRILTSLGVLGFPHFQMPLLYFLLTEAIVIGSLPNLDREHVKFWIDVIANDEERQMILEAWRALKMEQQREVPSNWNLKELRVEGKKSVKQGAQNSVLPKTCGNGLKKDIELDDFVSSFNQSRDWKHVEVETRWDLSDSDGDSSVRTKSIASKQTEFHDCNNSLPHRDRPQYLITNLSRESDKNGRTKPVSNYACSVDVKSDNSDIAYSHRSTTRTLITTEKEKGNTTRTLITTEKEKGNTTRTLITTEKEKGNTTRTLITTEKEKGDRSGWLTRFQDFLCGVTRAKSRNEDVQPYLCGVTSVKSRNEDVQPYLPKPMTLNANVDFYSNRKKSSVFWGHTFEEMLQWKGDYDRLEMNHQYIQWLFPIPDSSGVNFNAQALQPHEAEAFQKDPILQRRVLRAYQMMLDFYGMELVSEDCGQIRRTNNWFERYQHLNRSWHNHLRITRIIKSLGYLGLQKYQFPWVNFILHEIFEERVLPRLGGRQCLFWIEAITDETERDQTYESYIVLKENK